MMHIRELKLVSLDCKFVWVLKVSMLPKYLKACVKVDEVGAEYAFVKGSVKCECGSRNFSVFSPGATVQIDGKPCPCGYETHEVSFFLITVKCTECNREYLLFDQDYHGWDGFRCQFPGWGSLPRPPLKLWECISCGSKRHRIQIRIDPPDLQEYKQYLRGLGEPLDEEKWLLSFEWIWMAITCSECGMLTENWVDYETA